MKQSYKVRVQVQKTQEVKSHASITRINCLDEKLGCVTGMDGRTKAQGEGQAQEK